MPLPPNTSIVGVHSRLNEPTHVNVDGILFRNKRSQSAEMNDLQGYIQRNTKGISDALFADGNIIEGGNALIVEDDTEVNLRLLEGRVYLNGRVYVVPAKDFLVPSEGSGIIGVRYYSSVVDEHDDQTLLNPQVDSRGYAEPGALRYLSYLEWGWIIDAEDDGGTGEFTQCYTYDAGVIVIDNSDVGSDLVNRALARYDYEGNGSYVANGLRVQFIEASGGNYVFKIGAGTAHLLGIIYDRTTDSRLTFPQDADELASDNEFHIYRNPVNGKANIPLSRSPVSEVTEVIGNRIKEMVVVRGLVANTTDIIDPAIASIVSIIEVKQGGTTYAAGADFVLDGDEISWAPGGVEPAGGTNYTVKFQYSYTGLDVLDSTGVDFVVLTDIVVNSNVYVTYNYKLPRIDLIVMTQFGLISRIKGVAALQNPVAPQAGPNEIALATVEYSWIDSPRIRNIAVQAVHMSRLQEMQADIFTLFRMSAEERLRNNANAKDSASKFGVAVDSFIDDTQRDSTIEQTAAIVKGFMTLPIVVTPHELDGANANNYLLLPYTNVVSYEQPNATRTMKINAFKPSSAPDAVLRLYPDTDTWVTFVSSFTSQVTEILLASSIAARLSPSDANKVRRAKQIEGTASGVNAISDSAEALELLDENTQGTFVRQRDVSIRIKNFKPKERIASATFDGKSIASLINLQADLNGTLTATFTIPANIPTGIKSVFIIGNRDTRAEAAYTSSLVSSPWKRSLRYGPVAQTFYTTGDFQLSAVDIKIAKKGDTRSPIYIQIREVVNGVPGSSILAETELLYSEITVIDSRQFSGVEQTSCGVYENHPTTNYPKTDVLVGYRHSDNLEFRGFIKLSLPADFNNLLVLNAVLHVRMKSSDEMKVYAARLTQSFNETTASWDERSTGVAWTAPGGTFDATTKSKNVQILNGADEGDWVSINVSQIVQQWADGATNNGFMLGCGSLNITDDRDTHFDFTSAKLDIEFKRTADGILGAGWTRSQFETPVYLRGNSIYALCVLTADPDHEICISRIGDNRDPAFNNGASGKVAGQSGHGTLLVSSNGDTWTARQREDMAFRLVRASYTSTQVTIPLGKATAGNTTDIMLRAPHERFSGSTQVSFVVTLPGGQQVDLAPSETFPLSARLAGDFLVSAVIKGTETLSPILAPKPVLLTGNLTDNANYVIKRSRADDTFDARVILEVLLPTGSEIIVEVASQRYASGNRVMASGEYVYDWLTMAVDDSSRTPDGFTELVFARDDVRGVTLDNLSQARVTITGGPAARLLVRDFQFYCR